MMLLPPVSSANSRRRYSSFCNKADFQTVVNVVGNLKLGNFTLSFTDLTIMMGMITDVARNQTQTVMATTTFDETGTSDSFGNNITGIYDTTDMVNRTSTRVETITNPPEMTSGTTVTTVEAKQNISKLMELAFYKGEQIRITRGKRPMAWLVGEPFMDALQRILENNPGLVETLEIMLDPDAMAAIEQGTADVEAGKTIPVAEVLDE